MRQRHSTAENVRHEFEREEDSLPGFSYQVSAHAPRCRGRAHTCCADRYAVRDGACPQTDQLQQFAQDTTWTGRAGFEAFAKLRALRPLAQ